MELFELYLRAPKIPIYPFHAPSQNWMKLSHNGNDHPITARIYLKFGLHVPLPWLPAE